RALSGCPRTFSRLAGLCSTASISSRSSIYLVEICCSKNPRALHPKQCCAKCVRRLQPSPSKHLTLFSHGKPRTFRIRSHNETKNKNMKTSHVKLIPQSPLRLGFLLIPLTLGCFALSPAAVAVTPARDGSYPNQNTAEGEDALFSLTTGADNTAMGFDVLDSNTTGSDNALASWRWKATGNLNTARYRHTATLLQNGMVLVGAGLDSNFIPSASAELYDPASRSWTAAGSLNEA